MNRRLPAQRAGAAQFGVLALNAISDVSVPVKAYDYIGLDRPVLAVAPPESAMGRLFRRFAGAFVAQDEVGAVKALERIAAGGLRRLRPGPDPRSFSQQHQFERLLERLRGMMRAAGGRGERMRCAC